MLTSNPSHIHTIRLALGLVSFGIAMVIAAHLHAAKGSPFVGRVLLVMFSFSITLGQVARWDDPVKWNTIFTGITLVVGIAYCCLMVVEVRHKQRAKAIRRAQETAPEHQ